MNLFIGSPNAALPAFTMKRVGPGCYDIDCPALGFDAHLARTDPEFREDGAWTLDIFQSGVKDADAAHVNSEFLDDAKPETIAGVLKANHLIYFPQ